MDEKTSPQDSDFGPEHDSEETSYLTLRVQLEVYQQAADQLLKRAESLAAEALDAKECGVALLDRCSVLVEEYFQDPFMR